MHDLNVPIEVEEPIQHPGTAEPPFPPPQQINGLTEHGAQRVNGRDGHGVNDNAVQDAVNDPIKPPPFIPDSTAGRGDTMAKTQRCV
jgi:hypothetical protein